MILVDARLAAKVVQGRLALHAHAQEQHVHLGFLMQLLQIAALFLGRPAAAPVA